jgi:hypothetical protein
MPPQLDLEKSNIVNSENTSLFLFSCFQYILTSVILSAGPPFRKPMTQNGMHMSTHRSANQRLTKLSSTVPVYDHYRHSYRGLHAIQTIGMGV